MDDEQLTRAINLSYFYLNFRPRTKKELTDYLQKKAKRYRWQAQIVITTLKKLEDMELINDKKFIVWFVEQKSQRRPKSAFMLRRELQKHGVEKDEIEQYFEKNTLDEPQLARQAIETRWRRWIVLPKEKRFEKTASFLQRRGFSYDVIKKTIAELEEE